MGAKLQQAINRARRATKATGRAHYVVRDSHGEYTYTRKISKEDRFYWDINGTKYENAAYQKFTADLRRRTRKNPKRYPDENMTVRKTTQGYEVSDVVDGQLVHMHYIGYTKKEAVAKFKDDLQRPRSNAKRKRSTLSAAEKNALVQYYRVGIDGLQRVKGKTIKSLMNKGYFTKRGFTGKGRATAKRLSDEEHGKIFTRSNAKRKSAKRVRFYTDTDRYQGYVNGVNRETYLEIRSWLLSGNKVVIGKYAYDKSDLPRIRKMV